MSDNRDNDFWNTSNDDFWSKPVVTEDWLKGDEDKKSDSTQSESVLKTDAKEERTDSFWEDDKTEESKNEPKVETVEKKDNFWENNKTEEPKEEPKTEATEKRDSFWDTDSKVQKTEQKTESSDDFWKRPVYENPYVLTPEEKSPILHINPSSERREKKQEHPYRQQKPTGQGQQKTAPKPAQAQKPVVQSKAIAPVKSVVPGNRPNQEPSGSQNTQYKPVSAGKKEKKVHIHTILCLIFIALAVLSIVTSVLASQMLKSRAKKAAERVAYEETEVENKFVFNENNKITLKDNAYTLVSRENFMGFPEGQKLIAVYVKVESDTYVRDGSILETLYIGYEEEDGEIYKRPVMKEYAETYLSTSHVDRDSILSIYGIGNGSDYEGYYFFMVPNTVEEVVLYMEKMKKDHKALVVDTIYYRELPILSMAESEEQLWYNEGDSNESGY